MLNWNREGERGRIDPLSTDHNCHHHTPQNKMREMLNWNSEGERGRIDPLSTDHNCHHHTPQNKMREMVFSQKVTSPATGGGGGR